MKFSGRAFGISIMVLTVLLLAGTVSGTVSKNSWFKNRVLSGPTEPQAAPTPAADTKGAQGLVGGDTDVHGCKGSAGYTWCEAKKKCIRLWEDRCEAEAGKVYKSRSIEYCNSNIVNCEFGTMSFYNSAGCGCRHAFKYYMTVSPYCDIEPLVCEVNLRPFSDEWGCGCEPYKAYNSSDGSTHQDEGLLVSDCIGAAGANYFWCRSGDKCVLKFEGEECNAQNSTSSTTVTSTPTSSTFPNTRYTQIVNSWHKNKVIVPGAPAGFVGEEPKPVKKSGSRSALTEGGVSGYSKNGIDSLEIKVDQEDIRGFSAIASIRVRDISKPSPNWSQLKGIKRKVYSEVYDGYSFKIDRMIFDETDSSVTGLMVYVKRPDGTYGMTYLKPQM
jgi:hypothetical protein